MARRRSRKGTKIQPAVKTLNFTFAPSSTNYIDLSQCASLVNRRFYRQGLNWAVAGFTFYTTGTGTIGVSKIPDTWVASNAWEKGMRNWQTMNNEALDGSESIRPRFLDFKVFMDHEHATLGVAQNLIPGDADGTPYTLGEWDYSKYEIPTTDGTSNSNSREVIWTGASFQGNSPVSGLNSVSLIEGYAASRGLPDVLDPNVPGDAADADGNFPENWIAALSNEGTDQDSDILDTMIDENNIAPYPFENDGVHTDTMYPGGANQAPGLEAVSMSFVTPTTVGGRTTIGGTNFQGGLIKLHAELDGLGNQVMQVHLVPGPVRGYMTQPMQDV